MFKSYDSRIRTILSAKTYHTNWKTVLENHKEMIAIIQHERLIHLLVTIFVGAIMSASAFITILTKKTDLLFILIPLLFLFIGYILHYRFLENTTQSWYELEDEIKKM